MAEREGTEADTWELVDGLVLFRTEASPHESEAKPEPRCGFAFHLKVPLTIQAALLHTLGIPVKGTNGKTLHSGAPSGSIIEYMKERIKIQTGGHL
ncbi:hypothetical protein CRG98_045008 [Punica granatum]|uniref:Uncharacterized protein n=1 Tax=Punica granatum TaxID=22663 RepID=A0A2I0HSD3_PUNGR|nr:hypothetical protein CRG98_045008 [Punica granatum]